MKTLIVLMFCASIAAGQTLGTRNLDTGKWSIPDSSIKNEYFTLAILELYSRYEKECYNDSTRQRFIGYLWSSWQGKKAEPTWYPSDGKEIDPGFTSGFLGYKWEYVHRESTFQGFIEFLRKQGDK